MDRSDQSIENAAAIVLAGGKSSRMGRPKAMLGFGDEPLIVHIVRKLQALFPQVVVVAAPGQEIPSMADIHLVRDEVPYQGPVGGIYYGMRMAERPVCFVTSCDAPFLSVPLISHLVSEISEYDVVVPVWEERLQPLHAVYRSSVLPALREQLARNELRPIFLYEKVRTRRISEAEIRELDPEGLSFMNLNTQADYEDALRRWEERGRRSETEFTSSVRVTVELFGVARLMAKTKTITITLAPEATLGQVFFALVQSLPVLAGRVIDAETNRLSAGHSCNINGQNFVRDPNTRINAGDSIFILSADAGG